MSEPSAPGLVLRLSLPSARDYTAVAAEAAIKVAELLGHSPDTAKAAGRTLQTLVAEVAPGDGADEIALEFHHVEGELRMEARCAGRSSRASHPLPA